MAGKFDHLALYRPGTGTIWILNNTAGSFAAVYRRGAPGDGIGGYDLESTADRAFAFDFDSSGNCDHLALYRPGTGTFWILRNTGSTNDDWVPVFQQGDPGDGIGGYNLESTADLAFAFDFQSTGKLDHLVLYRPGTGTIWILQNDGGVFTPVFHQGAPGNGIGGYNLQSTADRIFAFDFDSSGKQDHLALYRPGTGTMWILKNGGGVFTPVFRQGDPGDGIGGYNLKSTADLAFAFDFQSTGKLDHMALYRPGTGTIWILKNTAGVFAPVFQQGDPGDGIGGYNLKSSDDRAFAFDFDSSGKQDHMALYRPGTGTIWILKNTAGVFAPVFRQGDPGDGIGGYDLKSKADQVFAFVDPPIAPTNPVPAPAAGLGSNSNYIFYNDCNPILGLSVTINITEDIVCQAASGAIGEANFLGFGFQLNASSQMGEASVFQQYFMFVDNNTIFGSINLWNAEAEHFALSTFPLALTTPVLIRGGTQLVISLSNNTPGAITGATFTVIDNQGQKTEKTVALTTLSGVTATDQAPIVSFELDIVGPLSGETSTLSSGAGTIIYTAKSTLTPLSQQPPCVTTTDNITAEMANTVYGVLSATPGTRFSQSFGTTPPSGMIRKPGARKQGTAAQPGTLG
jgi:hypothetical protein